MILLWSRTKPLETLARAPLMQVLERFHIDMNELVQYVQVLLHEDSSVKLIKTWIMNQWFFFSLFIVVLVSLVNLLNPS